MDYSQIDLQPMKPDYGMVWQGTPIDEAIHQIPGPLAIVSMNKDEDLKWIDHQTIHSVLSVHIDDDPGAVLPDNVYLGLVDAGIGLLKNGVSLYIHCSAGVSRASYYDIGLHMRVLNLSYDDAFALVHKQRPCICPNSGFVSQLKRLEPQLRQ